MCVVCVPKEMQSQGRQKVCNIYMEYIDSQIVIPKCVNQSNTRQQNIYTCIIYGTKILIAKELLVILVSGSNCNCCSCSCCCSVLIYISVYGLIDYYRL